MNHPCKSQEFNINCWAAGVLLKHQAKHLLQHLGECERCHQYAQDQEALCQQLFQKKNSPSPWSLEKREAFKLKLGVQVSTSTFKPSRTSASSTLVLYIKTLAALLILSCCVGYSRSPFTPSKMHEDPILPAQVSFQGNMLTAQSNLISPLSDDFLYPEYMTWKTESTDVLLESEYPPWPLAKARQLTSI
jgi:hypothetical protein